MSPRGAVKNMPSHISAFNISRDQLLAQFLKLEHTRAKNILRVFLFFFEKRNICHLFSRAHQQRDVSDSRDGLVLPQNPTILLVFSPRLPSVNLTRIFRELSLARHYRHLFARARVIFAFQRVRAPNRYNARLGSDANGSGKLAIDSHLRARRISYLVLTTFAFYVT